MDKEKRMKGLKTFSRGGIHPPENKISENASIQVLSLPPTVYIPVAQQLGAPATPIVAKGDKVKVGQLIAKASGFISANIHASVSGMVVKIDDNPDTSGYPRKSIVINVEGDEWIEGVDLSTTLVKECHLSRQEIIDRISQMGVVGLGGATFPAHIKFMVPQGKKAEVLLVNGVECEPYLTSDHRLMLEKGEELLVGITIQMKALNVDRAIIGIEANKPDAIAHLSSLSQQYPGITVAPLKVKYPQGGEKQLIEAVTLKVVPAGKLPIDVGVVVVNVGSSFAVYEAVQKNKPLVDRVVTVTGMNLQKPSNFLVRLGTPVKALIEAAGGLPSDTGKVVNGGPMMGKALLSLDVAVTKGTSGILLFSREESVRKPVLSCIRCARCVSACCMGLEPYLLAVLAEKGRFEDCEPGFIMNCIECGSCHFVCPSGRPLLDFIRVGKTETGRLIRKRASQ